MNPSKRTGYLIVLLIAALIMLSGCGIINGFMKEVEPQESGTEPKAEETSEREYSISLDEIPEYSGEPYIEINGNVPEFSGEEAEDLTGGSQDAEDYEETKAFSPLDELGRAGAATALLGKNSMPTEERGSIGMIRPSGWQLSKYDFIDDKYLYNRCHLIGWQLVGDNSEENLITGTRYMNVQGMLPFENRVAEYIRRTGNHVMYIVEPVFYDEELLARGVHMEAYSIEDDGEGLSFNVFCYNVQPGVSIDHATGENKFDSKSFDEFGGIYTEGNSAFDDKNEAVQDEAADEQAAGKETSEKDHYVLNTNTMRFHYPDCKSVSDMKDKNKKAFHGTREKAIEMGYKPCGNCNP